MFYNKALVNYFRMYNFRKMLTFKIYFWLLGFVFLRDIKIIAFHGLLH